MGARARRHPVEPAPAKDKKIKRRSRQPKDHKAKTAFPAVGSARRPFLSPRNKKKREKKQKTKKPRTVPPLSAHQCDQCKRERSGTKEQREIAQHNQIIRPSRPAPYPPACPPRQGDPQCAPRPRYLDPSGGSAASQPIFTGEASRRSAGRIIRPAFPKSV